MDFVLLQFDPFSSLSLRLLYLLATSMFRSFEMITTQPHAGYVMETHPPTHTRVTSCTHASTLMQLCKTRATCSPTVSRTPRADQSTPYTKRTSSSANEHQKPRSLSSLPNNLYHKHHPFQIFKI